jgi:hypothetical protein
MRVIRGFRDAMAGDFPGNTNPDSGLISFANELSLPNDNIDIVPVVTAVALQGDDAATVGTIDCTIFDPAGLATDQIKVRFLSGETGFSLAGCRIPIPRNDDGTIWQMRLITTGKSVAMSWIVAVEKGMAVVDDA